MSRGGVPTSMSSGCPCRTYIVYRHALFFRGVRSILEDRRSVQIVGTESDFDKALKAVRSLQPEVIIVEEPTRTHQSMRLGAFLHAAGASRIVTLSLDHSFATVYERSRVAAAEPSDLVEAILGTGKQRGPRPVQPRPTASTPFTSESGARSRERRSGRPSRVASAGQQEAQATGKPGHVLPRGPKRG